METWSVGSALKHVAVVFGLEFLIRTKVEDEREALKGF